VIDTDYSTDKSSLKAELLKYSNIQSVSESVSAPIDFVVKGRYPLNQNGKTDSIEASFLWVDEDFAKTYQLEIIKGEFLSDSDSDLMKEQKVATEAKNDGKTYSVSIPVVINQTAEKLFGSEDMIGKKLGNYVIKGVVKDFNFESLHHPISQLIMSKFPQATNTINIRIADNNVSETLKYIKAVFLKMDQNSSISFDFFEDLVKAKYDDIVVLRNLAIILSILALLVSSFGISALSIFLIERRVKEIGIRKINGAKTSEILTMLNRDFVKWVAIAFVIACPIAWYAMNKWLESFAFKTELSWWIFALAGLMALGIALLTVSWQSWKAATRNPVEALRYE
jgi:putative ABC transport system permease protein